MSLRRKLDRFYQQGYDDAMTYTVHSTAVYEARDDRYWMMAYCAGYERGEAERGRREREQYLAMQRQAAREDTP